MLGNKGCCVRECGESAASYFAAKPIIGVRLRVSLVLIALSLSCCLFEGCIIPVTRTVDDVYTRTTEDTLIINNKRNAPGSVENGVVFPTSHVVEVQRSVVQKDSLIRREYPAFIRLGLFESVGLIGSARSGKGIGTGLLGVYLNPADLLASDIAPKGSAVFGGGLYRFGILEYRLRWFRDAPNWTIGTSIFETFYAEASNERSLMSNFPLYIRKRFYLREEIPYVCVTPSFGLGMYPSQYINLSTSIDVGSMGGLNFRSYVGLISGVNMAGNTFNNTKSAQSFTTPYFGFGVSVLDFLNRVPELSTEWKDHEHSAWDVGIVRFTVLRTSQDSSFFGSAFPLQGFQLLGAPVSLALPWLGHRLYAGTELFNLVVVGGTKVKVFNQTIQSTAIGLGILPIRVGYWQPVLNDELSFEPFVEYSYYPNNMFQIGARLNLFATRSLNVALNAGYITSDGFDTSSGFFQEAFGSSLGAFSTVYVGISVGLFDRIFFEDELRYNRHTQ